MDLESPLVPLDLLVRYINAFDAYTAERRAQNLTLCDFNTPETLPLCEAYHQVAKELEHAATQAVLEQGLEFEKVECFAPLSAIRRYVTNTYQEDGLTREEAFSLLQTALIDEGQMGLKRKQSRSAKSQSVSDLPMRYTR